MTISYSDAKLFLESVTDYIAIRQQIQRTTDPTSEEFKIAQAELKAAIRVFVWVEDILMKKTYPVADLYEAPHNHNQLTTTRTLAKSCLFQMSQS